MYAREVKYPTERVNVAVVMDSHSFTDPLLSVARCSVVQLSELRQCGVNEIAKPLKWQQEDSNLGYLD